MNRDCVDAASRLARERLAAAYERIAPSGSGALALGGQLLRPVLALAGADAAAREDVRFWYAALAVQLAHEASLVHDDVVDRSATRRDAPTVFAAKGVASAVLEGDRLLTTAYVAASRTGSEVFMAHFARSVARTVDAEREQGRLLGARVDPAAREHIARGKAGELMGCAIGAAAMVRGYGSAACVELGRDIGVLYQMMDDLLDYCPASATGKPALGDYTQGRWTWPLDELPDARLGLELPELLDALHAPTGSGAEPTDDSVALARSAARLRDRIQSVLQQAATVLPDDPLVPALLEQWTVKIDSAVARERAACTERSRSRLSALCAGVVARDGGETGYLARHGRSFRFASRLLPRAEFERIARVYAFCRFTDDLVDDPASSAASGALLLQHWIALAGSSYRGEASGIALLDATMSDMRSAGVPFDHVLDLARGMQMDVAGVTYETLAELRVYTHRVAGVVGLWLAQLAGAHDPEALSNAERMGRAMQLTNILRDVGEDWRRGRLYLPADLLSAHGLTASDIGEMASGSRPLCAGYRAVIRELMAIAEAEYRAAFAWLPSLPGSLQPAMAVAAELYQGIHAELRGRGYDNLHLRASTSLARKVGIAVRAMRSLRDARAAHSAITGSALGHSASVSPHVKLRHGWQE